MVVLSILTLFFSVYGLICYEKRRKQKKTESLEKDFMHRTEMVMKIFLVLFVVALFFQIDYHFTLALGRGYLLEGTDVIEAYADIPTAHMTDLEPYKHLELGKKEKEGRDIGDLISGTKPLGRIWEVKDVLTHRAINYQEIMIQDVYVPEIDDYSGRAYDMTVEYYACRSEKIADRCVQGWKRMITEENYNTSISTELLQENTDVDEILVYTGIDSTAYLGDRDIIHPVETYFFQAGTTLKSSMESFRINHSETSFARERQILVVRKKNIVGIFRFDQMIADGHRYPYLKAKEWMPVYIEKMR